jgi:hypothetical protein
MTIPNLFAKINETEEIWVNANVAAACISPTPCLVEKEVTLSIEAFWKRIIIQIQTSKTA